MSEFNVNLGDIMVKFIVPEDRVVHGTGKVTDRVSVKVSVEVGVKHYPLVKREEGN